MTDNIHAHEHPESDRVREGGFTLWFTGLSGSGKSTIAHLVGPELDRRGCIVEYLDGDTVRTHLSKGLGFSKEDRDTNIERIGWVASRLVRHGAAVICAAISPYEETRRKARELVEEQGPFVEVFVRASVEECARRDVKGLYEKAFAGEIKGFTGVDDPYEEPENAEIVIDTEGQTPEESAQAVIARLEEMGLVVEVHHHEVATAGQCEIGVKFGSLVKKADDVMTLKYVVHNVAHSFGKTATFMPKPLLGDNGSGMHVHQSLAKGGKNLFQGDLYGGLSQTALYYIGGIMKHAHAINALTNASTNSYKRLVKGFEAPTLLAYSARNRSASIRVPYVTNPKARRIEVRFPDSTANPYLGFTAMLMAGLDGIANKINPGPPSDKDLYDLPPEEEKLIPTVSYSLLQSLEALDKDRGFLTAGGVLNDATIDAYIALKEQEITRFSMTPHPVEFEMYYSL